VSFVTSVFYETYSKAVGSIFMFLLGKTTGRFVPILVMKLYSGSGNINIIYTILYYIILLNIFHIYMNNNLYWIRPRAT